MVPMNKLQPNARNGREDPFPIVLCHIQQTGVAQARSATWCYWALMQVKWAPLLFTILVSCYMAEGLLGSLRQQSPVTSAPPIGTPLSQAHTASYFIIPKSPRVTSDIKIFLQKQMFFNANYRVTTNTVQDFMNVLLPAENNRYSFNAKW